MQQDHKDAIAEAMAFWLVAESPTEAQVRAVFAAVAIGDPKSIRWMTQGNTSATPEEIEAVVTEHRR